MACKRPPEPDPPPDPWNYVKVKTRKRTYYRRKRGTVKKGTKVNPALQQVIDLNPRTSGGARRIKEILQPYIGHLDTGSFIASFGGKMRSALRTPGTPLYACLEGVDLQQFYPLRRILQSGVVADVRGGSVNIRVPFNDWAVKRLRPHATDYQFEAIFLYGDATQENKLRIEVDASEHYLFDSGLKGDWTTSFVIPKKRPWMVLLKVSCRENGELVPTYRYHGMKVIKAG